ncbi:glycoside hydrolase [Hesseltinella vesiculosa]|uniref:glucan endo-1,3-beta-D-glucosidase n=1 Tax=Hesseltinella vesiculosa TaxID=101127 RepID=A0A1X2G923_9FUNG|nr:glycoside hydrolase [Hesseltinella vesiculosa]
MKWTSLAILPLVAATTPFYGLNFGIDQGNCPGIEHYTQLFKGLQNYTGRVRSYTTSVCEQGQLTVQAAQQTGMKVFLGMWIDRPDTFERESAALKKILQGNTQAIEAIIVGSEAVYRNDTDVPTLVNYIKAVKQMASPHNIPVTTSEVYFKIDPPVVDAVDFISFNAFPYWEAVSIDKAVNTFIDHYKLVSSNAKGKKVVVTETGWPSGGAAFGAAEASPDNSRQYLKGILCWAQKNDISLFYFSATDEPYKGGAEGKFGVLDANMNIKQPITSSDLENPCN